MEKSRPGSNETRGLAAGPFRNDDARLSI